MASMQPSSSAVPAHRHRRVRPRLIQRLIIYLLCIVLSVLFILPLIWTVFSSLKSPLELFIFPPKFFPETLQWSNYVTIFQDFPFPRWYGNTFLVVLLNTSGVLVTSSLVAYGFARFDFRFRGPLFM